MATLTIQINNNKALKLIQDLEDLDLIRILKNKKLAAITTEKNFLLYLTKVLPKSRLIK